LRDGQRRDANRARKNNEQGADGGENGAMNKKVDHKKKVASCQFPVFGAYCSQFVRAGFGKSFLGC
jgi:hypothetical protein